MRLEGQLIISLVCGEMDEFHCVVHVSWTSSCRFENNALSKNEFLCRSVKNCSQSTIYRPSCSHARLYRPLEEVF